MFTGIISEFAEVSEAQVAPTGATLAVRCPGARPELRLGDSVALNGCCLTVAELTTDGFVASLMPETLSRTAFSKVTVGQSLNLELPVAASGRFDGHMVQGHVDGIATIAGITPLADGSAEMIFSVPADLTRYVVEKGSIAFNGVSLTVIKATDTEVVVGFIPHTLAATSFGTAQIGDQVHVEVDVIAKYVEKMFGAR